MGRAYKVSTAVAGVSIVGSALFFRLAPLQRPSFHRPIVGMGFEMVLPARAAKEKEDWLSVWRHDRYLIGLLPTKTFTVEGSATRRGAASLSATNSYPTPIATSSKAIVPPVSIHDSQYLADSSSGIDDSRRNLVIGLLAIFWLLLRHRRRTRQK